LTVSVTGRTPTTTAPVRAESAIASLMKDEGVSGHSGSWMTKGAPDSCSAAKPTS
jgi:hypothetical protein